jgi:hypothetical protein
MNAPRISPEQAMSTSSAQERGSPVPRIGRLLDLVGLLLFLGGAATVAWAWIGFQGVSGYVPPSDAPFGTAIAVADRYWFIQKIGVAILLAGIATFVLAWWVARAAKRTAMSTAPATNPESRPE